jgi:hypothetical protein
MSSKPYYSNNTTGGNSAKYGKRKRSLDSGSSIVYTGSSTGSAKDRKYSGAIGKKTESILNFSNQMSYCDCLEITISHVGYNFIKRYKIYLLPRCIHVCDCF